MFLMINKLNHIQMITKRFMENRDLNIHFDERNRTVTVNDCYF